MWKKKEEKKRTGGAGSKQGVQKVKENKEIGLLKTKPNQSGSGEPDRFGVPYK